MRLLRFLPLALSLLVASLTVLAQGSERRASPSVIHQLRIYQIFDSNKRAFHERFRDRAMPIMKRYGFRILAMWESRSGNRTEFVYLLEWKDAQTMERQWRAFLADEEWIRVKRETAASSGALVGEISSRKLELVDYSPRIRSVAGSGE